MNFNPDQIVLWQWGWVKLNVTILYTWLIMAGLAGGAALITRRLEGGENISHWQNLLEVVVGAIAGQIEEVTRQRASRFLPFIGTLFLFILVANVLAVVPYYMPPTGSISTTAALALCVFVAVPGYGLAGRSLTGYLREYLQPSVFMLPFNVIGEFTRTFALAVRLYGNLMSSTVIGMVLALIMPLFFPVVMQLLGLLTGVIQAYIFAVLALVYIASALKQEEGGGERKDNDTRKGEANGRS